MLIIVLKFILVIIFIVVSHILWGDYLEGTPCAWIAAYSTGVIVLVAVEAIMRNI